jgi:hypothetical protein
MNLLSYKTDTKDIVCMQSVLDHESLPILHEPTLISPKDNKMPLRTSNRFAGMPYEKLTM